MTLDVPINDVDLESWLLMNMIAHLSAEYGFTRKQAYAICSVAVDLKVSEMADVPNFVVSAFLPLDVLADRRKG